MTNATEVGCYGAGNFSKMTWNLKRGQNFYGSTFFGDKVLLKFTLKPKTICFIDGRKQLAADLFLNRRFSRHLKKKRVKN
jgi:hypothetical protein